MSHGKSNLAVARIQTFTFIAGFSAKLIGVWVMQAGPWPSKKLPVAEVEATTTTCAQNIVWHFTLMQIRRREIWWDWSVVKKKDNSLTPNRFCQMWSKLIRLGDNSSGKAIIDDCTKFSATLPWREACQKFVLCWPYNRLAPALPPVLSDLQQHQGGPW